MSWLNGIDDVKMYSEDNQVFRGRDNIRQFIRIYQLVTVVQSVSSGVCVSIFALAGYKRQ